MRVLAVLVGLAAAHGASIRGGAADNLTGRPLARARVTLEPVGKTRASASASVFTDAGGQFSFPGLPAGAYLIKASRRGYLEARYGQRRWNSPGTPVVLEEHAEHVALLRLHRHGVITGEVLDQNRVGMEEMPVYVFRAGPQLRLAAAAATDDRGVFRAGGLEPGRYYVRTAAKLLEDRQGLLLTFYGQTARLADARLVEVRLDEEVTGITVEPLRGRLASISGTVAGPVSANITLYTDTGKREARAEPGGTFSFDQLAPGQYDILAESADAGSALSASRTVSVVSERETVSIELAPSPSLRIRCEELSQRAFPARNVSLFVRRLERGADASSRRIACGERITLTPGHWEMATAPPPDYYVASIRGAEPSGSAYSFALMSRQSLEVHVAFSSRTATLGGKVRTSDGQAGVGAPVFLYPLDMDLRSRMGGVRTARADENGNYLFVGLAPGRYEALSSFDIQDPGEAAWPAGRGKVVTADEGRTSTQDLEVEVLDNLG